MSDPRPSPALRAAVEARAGRRCEYCRSPSFACPDPFAVEHITPRAAGGTLDPGNVAWSCQGCNAFKGVATEAADPLTGGAVMLFRPPDDRWADHFAWEGSDYTTAVGLTPCGRATVVRLRLNRPEVVTLRRMLYAFGDHPPE